MAAVAAEGRVLALKAGRGLASEHHGQVVGDPQVDVQLEQIGPVEQRSHVSVEMREGHAEGFGPIDLCPQLGLGLAQLGVADDGRVIPIQITVAVEQAGDFLAAARTGPQR